LAVPDHVAALDKLEDSGYVREIAIPDRGAVKAGDVLFCIDDGDYCSGVVNPRSRLSWRSEVRLTRDAA
jgi:hypothetical protein